LFALKEFCFFYLFCKLRYFDAIDTNHLELELRDECFAINDADVIGVLNAQEYDATIFGALDAWKNPFSSIFATPRHHRVRRDLYREPGDGGGVRLQR
jgi:hypothetical protein